jgi:prepilin-type N-terminal cleavage/methylation domain-containing protein
VSLDELGRFKRFFPVSTPDEAGFTLIELLLVMVILPLVMGAVAVVVVSTLKDQTTVASKVSDSSDSRITSAYYARDVQSASQITTAPPGAPGLSSPSLCGSGTTNLLSIQLSASTVVSYWAVNDGASWVLQRSLCPGGANPPSETITVFHGILTNPPVAAISPASLALNAASGWTPTSSAAGGVAGITLAVTEQASNYQFNLVATPRTWNSASIGQPGGNSPDIPPLLLLGGGPPVLTSSGKCSVNVAGQVYFDPTANGAAVLSGKATLSAAGYFTANQNNPSQTIWASGNAGYLPPGAPTPGPVYPDPYASLTPPSTAGMTQYSDGAYHGPGEYTTALSLSGGTVQAFASGVYVFDQGISITGNASISSAPGGVLFYVGGGSTLISTNGGVVLAPLTPNSYKNIVLWQAMSDSQPISLGSGNSLPYVLTGVIYAPSAQVQGLAKLKLTVSSVASKSVDCSGQVSITATG